MHISRDRCSNAEPVTSSAPSGSSEHGAFVGQAAHSDRRPAMRRRAWPPAAAPRSNADTPGPPACARLASRSARNRPLRAWVAEISIDQRADSGCPRRYGRRRASRRFSGERRVRRWRPLFRIDVRSAFALCEEWSGGHRDAPKPVRRAARRREMVPERCGCSCSTGGLSPARRTSKNTSRSDHAFLVRKDRGAPRGTDRDMTLPATLLASVIVHRWWGA
jgi:hypothetical protein